MAYIRLARCAAGAVAILIGLVAVLFDRLFGERGAELSADEVAGYIDDVLQGRGGAWDWDDFTSIPIADPQLDELRQEAQMVNLPLDAGGRTKLETLRARAITIADKSAVG